MEVGRTPIIAPVPAADTNVSSGGSRATELPQFQSVQQAAGSESTTLTFREVAVREPENTSDEQAEETAEASSEARNDRVERETRRDFEVDRETSALIFRSIDVSTGDVVQQYPEEARLNLRAYLEGQEAALAEANDA